VVTVPEEQLSDAVKADRLDIYRDSNDAFRNLLLGKFGRLPLGFPPDWVYESAFGPDYREAIARRTETSPLTTLEDVDMAQERQGLAEHIGRKPSDEELLMYLSHPGDALNTIKFAGRYGDCNRLPLHVWFEGIAAGEEFMFKDSGGKHHVMSMRHISSPDESGMSLVAYTLDSESFSMQVKVAEAAGQVDTGVEMADANDPYQVGSPSNGDLWVVLVKPGDMVLAPVDGMVERVLKFANYQEDRKMVPVKEGELLVQLAPAPRKCPTCAAPVSRDDFKYCPSCGQKV
jgi:pyruvate carboxylase